MTCDGGRVESFYGFYENAGYSISDRDKLCPAMTRNATSTGPLTVVFVESAA